MSSNGRRRWRVFARNVRKREPGCFSNKSGHGALLRRHPDYAESAPLSIPRPAFAARSLVGMSNSCRKWLARVDLLKSIYGEETKTWDRRRAKRELIDWSKKLAHPIAQDLYRAARKLNRVGDRLRPCPNPWCSKEDGCAIRGCRGNGLLPARKARKVRG